MSLGQFGWKDSWSSCTTCTTDFDSRAAVIVSAFPPYCRCLVPVMVLWLAYFPVTMVYWFQLLQKFWGKITQHGVCQWDTHMPLLCLSCTGSGASWTLPQQCKLLKFSKKSGEANKLLDTVRILDYLGCCNSQMVQMESGRRQWNLHLSLEPLLLCLHTQWCSLR